MMQIIRRNEGWRWSEFLGSYVYFEDEIRCGGALVTDCQEIVAARKLEQLG